MGGCAPKEGLGGGHPCIGCPSFCWACLAIHKQAVVSCALTILDAAGLVPHDMGGAGTVHRSFVIVLPVVSFPARGVTA